MPLGIIEPENNPTSPGCTHAVRDKSTQMRTRCYLGGLAGPAPAGSPGAALCGFSAMASTSGLVEASLPLSYEARHRPSLSRAPTPDGVGRPAVCFERLQLGRADGGVNTLRPVIPARRSHRNARGRGRQSEARLHPRSRARGTIARRSQPRPDGCTGNLQQPVEANSPSQPPPPRSSGRTRGGGSSHCARTVRRLCANPRHPGVQEAATR